MFQICNNEFLTKRQIKYNDENENTITVFGEKNGENFTAKIRMKDKNIIVDSIKLNFPYEVEGINFRVKRKVENSEYEYLASKDIPNEIIEILKDSLDVIARWIDIQLIMTQISQFPSLMKMMSSEQFNSGDSFVNILEQGKKYEELKDVMNIYMKMFTEETL